MYKSLLNQRPTLCLILALPGIPLLAGVLSGSMTPHVALHPTGETATRLMIIAMLISPLRVIFPRSAFLYWFLRRRRDIGVASFVYALAHTVFYLIDKGTLAAIMGELGETGIWTGWLAMLIFVPLALTSNDYAVRMMGRMWKSLQRWTYAAAVLVVAHWAFVDGGIGGVIVHFLPLAALEAWRVYKTQGWSQPALG